MSTQTRRAFTNRSGIFGVASTQLMASNAARNGLFIQNVHATATAAVNLVGGTAALNTANSMMLLPGGAILLDNAVPTAAINVITSDAAGQITAYEW